MTRFVPTFLWLVAASAGAREAPSPPADAPAVEERVEVRAQVSEAHDVAAFSTSLDLDDASRRGADLSDMLKQVPGARVHDYGGLGSFSTVTLRASTAEQVTLLIDGVPQNRALGGSAQWSSVPVSQIESVKVFRGFAPAALSTGGIGGLIDVRTRKPGAEPELALDLLAGELDTQRLSGSATLEAAGGMLRVGLEALETDSDFVFWDDRGTPFNAQDDGYARRINADVDQSALVLRETWDGFAGGELGLGVRAERRERGVPGKGNVQSSTARLDDTLFDLAGSWRRTFDGFTDNVELTFDGFRQDTESRVGEDPFTVQRDRDTRLFGGGLTALARASAGRHALMARADLRDERARLRERAAAGFGEAEYRRRSLALSFEDVIVAGRLTLAPSVRGERWRNDVRATGPELDDFAWSGKIGVSFAASEHVAVRGSAGRYQRNPSLIELFGDTGEVVGNPGLTPERGDTAELGCEWHDSRGGIAWRGEIVGFTREVEDLIWYDQLSQGVRRPRNWASADIEGIEVAAALEGWGGLSFDATAAWTRSEDDSSLFSTGHPLPYQPEWTAWFGSGWRRGRLEARWEVTYAGVNAVDRQDTPELRILERTLHDLYVSWSWPHGLRTGIDVRNVFDRDALDVVGYPLPDQTVYVHVGWQSERGR